MSKSKSDFCNNIAHSEWLVKIKKTYYVFKQKGQAR